MRNRRTIQILATGLLGWAVASAGAQIDVTPTGRLLDANPAVGGNGLNYSRPVSPIMSGNNFATGNVRGGMALRSFSPIQEASSFRGSLGSTSLSNFVRDSVGVADAYRPLNARFNSPFLDRSLTTTSVGYLQGQGQYTGQTPLNARSRNLPGLLDSSGSTYGQIDFRPQQRPEFQENAAPWELSSSMFAATPLNSPELPELSEMQQPSWLSEFRRPIGREEVELAAASSEVTPWLPIDYRLPVVALEDEPAVDLQTTLDTDPLGLLTRRADQLDVPESDSTSSSSVFVDPSLVPGQSVFNDIQLALSLEEEPDAEWYSELREAILEDPEMSEDLQERATEQGEAFVQRMLAAPLRTFAGEGDDPANRALLRAEALMHQDDYAAAAREFQKAALYDRANPLPHIGRAHALLAAGSYRSAAESLIHGLEMYSSLIRFRVDLVTLLGGGEIVDIRRSDLMQLLERNEDERLRFLLGYLEIHTGQEARGMENLDKAAEQSPFGSFIQRYPQLLRQRASQGSRE